MLRLIAFIGLVSQSEVYTDLLYSFNWLGLVYEYEQTIDIMVITYL